MKKDLYMSFHECDIESPKMREMGETLDHFFQVPDTNCESWKIGDLQFVYTVMRRIQVEKWRPKSLEKTLNTSFAIVVIGDKKMVKEIEVDGIRYFVYDTADLVSIAHELARKGYPISEIANALGVSERKVRRYLESC